MKLESFCAVDTEKIAFDFGKNAVAGDIFCLSGILGAGKTVFARGLARGVGYTGRVVSPTFTIVNEYHGGRFPVYHFDLYRLEGSSDLEEIGYEEYFFSGGICLVEWPERAENFFRKNSTGSCGLPVEKIIFVKIGVGENDFREISIENTGN